MQPGGHAGLARYGGRLCSGCQQAVPDLRHLGQQRVRDLLAEKVRVMELHHAPVVPPLAALGPPIAVDHHHVTGRIAQRLGPAALLGKFRGPGIAEKRPADLDDPPRSLALGGVTARIAAFMPGASPPLVMT